MAAPVNVKVTLPGAGAAKSVGSAFLIGIVILAFFIYTVLRGDFGGYLKVLGIVS